MVDVRVQHLSRVAASYKTLIDPRSGPIPLRLAVELAKAVVAIDKTLEGKQKAITEMLEANQQLEAEQEADQVVSLDLPVVDPEMLEAHDLCVNLEALMVLTYYELVKH